MNGLTSCNEVGSDHDTLLEYISDPDLKEDKCLQWSDILIFKILIYKLSNNSHEKLLLNKFFKLKSAVQLSHRILS